MAQGGLFKKFKSVVPRSSLEPPHEHLENSN